MHGPVIVTTIQIVCGIIRRWSVCILGTDTIQERPGTVTIAVIVSIEGKGHMDVWIAIITIGTFGYLLVAGWYRRPNAKRLLASIVSIVIIIYVKSD